MSSVTYQPSHLDLGFSDLGETIERGVRISGISSQAHVTAQIVDQSPHAQFKVESLASYILVEKESLAPAPAHGSPIGVGNPGRKVKTKVEQFQDSGSTSLEVFAGQDLVIIVSFTAPRRTSLTGDPGVHHPVVHNEPDPSPFRQLVPGTYTATLLIQSDAWDTISIPLSISLLVLEAAPSAAGVDIRQAKEVIIAVEFFYIFGPAVNVEFSMEYSEGISLAPTIVPFSSGSDRKVLLLFSVAPNTPLGRTMVKVNTFFPMVGTRHVGWEGIFNVHPGEVIIGPVPPITVHHASTVDISLPVSLAGSATQVLLEPGDMSTGVTMSPTLVSGPSASTTNAVVRFSADAHAQVSGDKGFSQTIHWSAYDGQETGDQGLIMNVKPVEAAFHPSGKLSAGQVDCKEATVACDSTGSWLFWGNVFDNSIVYGDNYAIGFTFNNGGYGALPKIWGTLLD